ncbi:MAG TPA: DUF3347 domain-containing protein [Flavisolibacter sp.]|nr:DUF3347 domain-containing protein [Flavisolibacter sp.]
MRLIVIFLVLAGAGIITWLVLARPEKAAAAPKQQAIVVSKHSEFFNSQVNNLMTDYYKIGESLVEWDSVGSTSAAASFIKILDSTKLDELAKDSTIYLTALTFIENVKGEAATVMNEKSIRSQREAFNSMTDNLYQFFNTVKYDREMLYLQQCPMAFDDTQAALWLSQKPEIRNPYLGLHHPTYGKGMLSCGETKQTINHTGKND